MAHHSVKKRIVENPVQQRIQEVVKQIFYD